MRGITNKLSRRDVLKTIGGMLGGVSLLGHGTAHGQALGSMPSGYSFYRVLKANEGGSFSGTPNTLGDMTGSVMVATPPSNEGIGYVYLHGTDKNSGAAAVFEITINYSRKLPAVERVVSIAAEGNFIKVDHETVVIGHIGTGASNAQGQYVTTIEPLQTSGSIEVDNSPGVYAYRAAGNGNGLWSRIIKFGDPVPDQSSLYGGDFGDVALDDDENLLLAAATTQSPGDNVFGFGGSQALISTSLSAPARGRVLLQTGDILPLGAAVVECVGLVDLGPRNAFAAQLTAKRPDPSVTRSGTALIAGDTRADLAQQSIVAASPHVIPPGIASQRSIASGETFFGPRVDPFQDVAFVTHDGAFEPSIGSNAIQTLGYYSRGTAWRIQNTEVEASADQVAAFGAPCIGSTGLMYGVEMLGSGRSRLFVSNGLSSEYLLLSEEHRVAGRNPGGELMISEMLFGHHSTQVDAFGHLAFTAEFLLDPDPRMREVPGNVITALVIGIPK